MLSSADLAMMRSALSGSDPLVSAGLLPDTCDIETKTETGRSAAGPTYSYSTTGAAVPCRFDPASTVERVIGGRTVWVTEWPVWFALGTAPTLGQTLSKASTRYEVVGVDANAAWNLLDRAVVRRLEGASR